MPSKDITPPGGFRAGEPQVFAAGGSGRTAFVVQSPLTTEEIGVLRDAQATIRNWKTLHPADVDALDDRALAGIKAMITKYA